MLEIVWELFICFEIGVLAKYKQSILLDFFFYIQRTSSLFYTPRRDNYYFIRMSTFLENGLKNDAVDLRKFCL